MYASLLLVSWLAAVSAQPTPTQAEQCIKDIQESYARNSHKLRRAGYNQSEIIKKVMLEVDTKKCQNVRVHLKPDDEGPKPRSHTNSPNKPGRKVQRIRYRNPYETITENLNPEESNPYKSRKFYKPQEYLLPYNENDKSYDTYNENVNSNEENNRYKVRKENVSGRRGPNFNEYNPNFNPQEDSEAAKDPNFMRIGDPYRKYDPNSNRQKSYDRYINDQTEFQTYETDRPNVFPQESINPYEIKNENITEDNPFRANRRHWNYKENNQNPRKPINTYEEDPLPAYPENTYFGNVSPKEHLINYNEGNTHIIENTTPYAVRDRNIGPRIEASSYNDADNHTWNDQENSSTLKMQEETLTEDSSNDEDHSLNPQRYNYPYKVQQEKDHFETDPSSIENYTWNTQKNNYNHKTQKETVHNKRVSPHESNNQYVNSEEDENSFERLTENVHPKTKNNSHNEENHTINPEENNYSYTTQQEQVHSQTKVSPYYAENYTLNPQNKYQKIRKESDQLKKTIDLHKSKNFPMDKNPSAIKEKNAYFETESNSNDIENHTKKPQETKKTNGSSNETGDYNYPQQLNSNEDNEKYTNSQKDNKDNQSQVGSYNNQKEEKLNEKKNDPSKPTESNDKTISLLKAEENKLNSNGEKEHTTNYNESDTNGAKTDQDIGESFNSEEIGSTDDKEKNKSKPDALKAKTIRNEKRDDNKVNFIHTTENAAKYKDKGITNSNHQNIQENNTNGPEKELSVEKIFNSQEKGNITSNEKNSSKPDALKDISMSYVNPDENKVHFDHTTEGAANDEEEGKNSFKHQDKHQENDINEEKKEQRNRGSFNSKEVENTNDKEKNKSKPDVSKDKTIRNEKADDNKNNFIHTTEKDANYTDKGITNANRQDNEENNTNRPKKELSIGKSVNSQEEGNINSKEKTYPKPDTLKDIIINYEKPDENKVNFDHTTEVTANDKGEDKNSFKRQDKEENDINEEKKEQGIGGNFESEEVKNTNDKDKNKSKLDELIDKTIRKEKAANYTDKGITNANRQNNAQNYTNGPKKEQSIGKSSNSREEGNINSKEKKYSKPDALIDIITSYEKPDENKVNFDHTTEGAANDEDEDKNSFKRQNKEEKKEQGIGGSFDSEEVESTNDKEKNIPSPYVLKDKTIRKEKADDNKNNFIHTTENAGSSEQKENNNLPNNKNDSKTKNNVPGRPKSNVEEQRISPKSNSEQKAMSSDEQNKNKNGSAEQNDVPDRPKHEEEKNDKHPKSNSDHKIRPKSNSEQKAMSSDEQNKNSSAEQNDVPDRPKYEEEKNYKHQKSNSDHKIMNFEEQKKKKNVATEQTDKPDKSKNMKENNGESEKKTINSGEQKKNKNTPDRSKNNDCDEDRRGGSVKIEKSDIAAFIALIFRIIQSWINFIDLFFD